MAFQIYKLEFSKLFQNWMFLIDNWNPKNYLNSLKIPPI